MIELSVTNLRHGFEVGQNIFQDVTFQVDTGERVGLLGYNGAGKTTLLRMICGQLEPDSGSIQVAKGSRVGLISQIPVYPAGTTVEDVLNSAFFPAPRYGKADGPTGRTHGRPPGGQEPSGPV